MRKQCNTIRHDPENGSWGNCHQACYASIFDLDLSEIPHFFIGGTDIDAANKSQHKWLAKRGLVMGDMLFEGTCPLEDVLLSTKLYSPGIPFILGCTSGIDAGHSVVIMDGEVWHDPSGSGVKGPLDGYWWLTFFSPNFTSSH